MNKEVVNTKWFILQLLIKWKEEVYFSYLLGFLSTVYKSKIHRHGFKPLGLGLNPVLTLFYTLSNLLQVFLNPLNHGFLDGDGTFISCLSENVGACFYPNIFFIFGHSPTLASESLFVNTHLMHSCKVNKTYLVVAF